MVDANGGPPHLLPTGTAGPAEPFWSRDGRWIYFLDEKDSGIWKVAAEGGTAVRLTKNAGATPQESADGTRVFYAVQTASGAELRSASANGGDERPVAGMPVLAWADQMVPQNGLYFLDAHAMPPTLNLFDPATRRLQRILELKGQLPDWGAGLSISNDGSMLVYAESDPPSPGTLC